MSESTTAAPAREGRPSLELLDHLVEEVETVFHGKREVVRLALAALLAGGHVLFEDVPGVGKTTLSHALAKALGLGFRRIQFTSDLLPSDVLGVSVYDPRTTEFEVRPGPIFTNVVLASYYHPLDHQPGGAPAGLLTEWAQPFYIFQCYDHAEELLAELRLVVKEWNEEHEFYTEDDPDSTGIEPHTGHPINDRRDWADATPGSVDFIGFAQ